MWAVLALAAWTVVYHVGSLADVPAATAWVAWAVVACALVALVPRLPRGPWTGQSAWHAGVLGAGAAFLASCLIRPDLDDASYLVRSAWIARTGVLHPGDVIFSGGAWPGLPEQTPYLPSFEALLGATSRVTSISAGALTYVVYVPLASFAAVWALGMLARTWRVRRIGLVVTLAAVVLLWGGGINASWGNLHLGRIWQGKVTLLAVLVPLTYALAAWCVTARGPVRRLALLVVAAAGIAGVGLSPSAVFVVPGVLAVSAVGAVLSGRGRAGVLAVLAGSAYPLAAGIVTAVAGRTGEAIPGSTPVNPWIRTLGSGVQAWVVLLAAVAVLITAASRRMSAARRVIGRWTAAAAAVSGAVLAAPPTTDLLVRVMGTDAIAWRMVWVVPVPLLVGMLAGVGRVRVLGVVVAVATSVALVAGGLPLWSARNNATLAAPGSWKMAAGDLETARWLVGAASGGRYLAREQVVAAVGVLDPGSLPVGSRPGYVEAYRDVDGAMVDERLLLQNLADGVASPEPDEVGRALARLDVRLVCFPADRGGVLEAGWTAAYRGTTDTCWVRDGD
nr:DUF6077 domain-containing protein [Cellulomonas hominis]